MRGWLSLAQNILQPPLPSFSLSLSLSLSLVVSRKRDPEMVPLPRRCSLRKRRRRRREVDRYDPELIRIAQRRRRGQLGERDQKERSHRLAFDLAFGYYRRGQLQPGLSAAAI